MAAYEILLLNTAIPQIQAAQSGDTYLVPRDIAFSAALTLSAGTANGVPYLNASKVLTTGSALTFDGTNLGVGGTSAGPRIQARGTINNEALISSIRTDISVETAIGSDGGLTAGFVRTVTNHPLVFGVNNAEQMRLTSTGLKASIAGTNADPVFSYTSDTNTGIFFPAADKLGFTAGGGSDQMVLTSTGLGIGTNNPGFKLDVAALQAVFRLASTTGTNPVYMFTTNTGGDFYVGRDNSTGSTFGSNTAYTSVLWSAGAYPMAFFTNGTEKMRLDSSGNLGLGVTPSAWNTGYKAFVAGGTNANNQVGGIASGSGITIVSTNYYRSTAPSDLYAGDGFAMKYTQSSGQHIWETAASGTAGNLISFTQAMTLDASGNLGVGETNPGARLHVDSGSTGNYAIFKSTNANGGYAAFYSSSTVQGDIGTAAQIVSGGAATDFGVNARGSRNLIFGTNNAERARITSGGYFKASDNGSYNNVAGTYHEFYQSANNIGLVVDSTNASLANEVLWLAASRNTTNNSFYAISYYNSGAAAYKFRVADSGDVTNTNGTYGTISDAKMKTDIVDAGSQWSDIKALRFRKFKMKDDPSGLVQLGVVAQEVELTSPGLVDEHADKDAEGNDLGTTTKSVKTSVLLMKAAVALQEAMARIEKLEAEVAALKGA